MPRKRSGKKTYGPTKEITDKLYKALSGGVPPAAACELFGLSYHTVKSWLAIGKNMQELHGVMDRVPTRFRPHVELVIEFQRGQAGHCAMHVQNINKIAFGGQPIKTKSKRVYGQVTDPMTGELKSQLLEETEETVLTPPSLAASIFMLTHGQYTRELFHTGTPSSPVSKQEQLGDGSDGPGSPNPSLPGFTVILEEQPRLSSAPGTTIDTDPDGKVTKITNVHTAADYKPHSESPVGDNIGDSGLQGTMEYHSREVIKVAKGLNGYAGGNGDDKLKTPKSKYSPEEW